jgi:hypothetical protein
LDKLDGINAARFCFSHLRFNATPTEELFLALKSYHRTWDEDKKAFTNEDVHDWSSHYADMFRYLAVVARFPHSRPLDPPTPATYHPTELTTATHYPITLEQLWENHNHGSRNLPWI